MRIERPKPSDSFQLRYESELRALLSQPPLDARPTLAALRTDITAIAGEIVELVLSEARRALRRVGGSRP